MIVLGIDPGSSHTGWCVARDNPLRGEEHIRFGSLRIREPESVYHAAWRLRRGLVAEFGRLGFSLDEIEAYERGGLIDRVFVEQAPITSKKTRVGRDGELHTKGNEGEIGWRQGWAAATMALVLAPRVAPEPVPVSTWRETMCIESSRAGFLLQAPQRTRTPQPETLTTTGRIGIVRVEPVGGNQYFVYYRCGHRGTCPSFDNLDTDLWSTCQECRRGGTKTPSAKLDGDEIRDAWKATACRFVARWCPTQYAALVQDARSRARDEHPDHRLQGVSDGCEAVGIALHGLVQ